MIFYRRSIVTPTRQNACRTGSLFSGNLVIHIFRFLKFMLYIVAACPGGRFSP